MLRYLILEKFDRLIPTQTLSFNVVIFGYYGNLMRLVLDLVPIVKK
jgi:hypothetical protein